MGVMVGRSATGRQPLGCWEVLGGKDGPLIGELGAYCVRIMRIIRAYPSTPSRFELRTTPHTDGAQHAYCPPPTGSPKAGHSGPAPRLPGDPGGTAP